MIKYSIIIRMAAKFSALVADNRFIALTSRLAVTGIMLGVATLITVLAVMRGFDEEIRHKLVRDVDHLSIYSYADYYPPSLKKELQSLPFVTDVYGYMKGYALVQSINRYLPIILYASEKEQGLVTGGIYFPEDNYLYYEVGEEVGLVVANGALPKVVQPIYQGHYLAGVSPKGVLSAYVNMETFKALMDIDTLSGYAVVLDDLYASEHIKQWVHQRYPGLFDVMDWKDRYAPLFRALQLQRSVMVFILSMITLVAMFSKVSGLVMMVSEHQKEIALLQVMGMSKRMIRYIFVLSGMWMSLLGSIGGVLLALLLCMNASSMTTWLEQCFGMTLVDTRIYGVSTLPVRLDLSLVMGVLLMALFFGFLATLYPAKRASEAEISTVLRHG